jgi:hypothetical protein
MRLGVERTDLDAEDELGILQAMILCGSGVGVRGLRLGGSRVSMRRLLAVSPRSPSPNGFQVGAGIL